VPHRAYTNLTLAGSLVGGGPLALVAGTHGPNFPYFHPASQWDSVLLLAGHDPYAISAREIEGLSFNVDDGSGQRDGHIEFEGVVHDAAGRSVEVEVSLPVKSTGFRTFQLGRPLGIRFLPGATWRPFHLGAAPGGYVVIDGHRHEVEGFQGHLETGRLRTPRGERFAVVYDYVALASEAYAYVSFVIRPLRPVGVFARVLAAILARFATTELTFVDGNLFEGDARGASGSQLNVLISDTIDVGPADLNRQLVRGTDTAGTTQHGLREVFHPHA
jgi:hypothetical protein